MKVQYGANIVNSYKRLPYRPWYAIAEFVDNSTQSYFDHQHKLDEVYAVEHDILTVRIAYDQDELLRIYDNAMGMSYDELERALNLGEPPENPDGRSKYGLGLKTGAFWMGDEWTIITKKLGDTVEHRIHVTLKNVLADNELDYQYHQERDPSDHYTVIEITKHNQKFVGRTLGKIKDYLKSIYRDDIRKKKLILEWRGDRLTWEEPELLMREDNTAFYRDFEFEVDGNAISGWVGILERGSRAKAGFSILQYGRVIRGWPNAWRPQSLFGQEGGSNNLVNQRLVGEINLPGFEVSHTKDDILWMGNQEEQVERKLEETCGDFARFAQEYRRSSFDGRGPSDAATSTAIDELKRELESPEMVDKIRLTDVPDEEVVTQAFKHAIGSVVERQQETFRVRVGTVQVIAYVNEDMSPSEPYVLSEPSSEVVIVIVNTSHPHWKQLNNQEVLNYLRHCVYDAVAEWKARSKSAKIEPNTIKKLKDELLRVSFEMEQSGDPDDEYEFEDYTTETL